MHGAPICHPLAFFSQSPLPLDFDGDFFRVNPSELATHAQVKILGAIGRQQIYEIKQTAVHRGQTDSPPTMKILVVERHPDEFCDIYQNQYAYDPTHETDEAGIVEFAGRKVLKSYETDMRTWFLNYWTLTNGEPVHLNLDSLYKAIRSATPPAAQPFKGPLNLTGSHLQITLLSKDSQTELGTVELTLSLQGDNIVASITSGFRRQLSSSRPQQRSHLSVLVNERSLTASHSCRDHRPRNHAPLDRPIATQ